MPAWTNATVPRTLPPDLPRPPTASEAGPLRPAEALQHFTLDRPAAHPDLDPWVERYWCVRWSLPGRTSYLSQVLTHPAVHLTVESGLGPRHGIAMPAALLHGVVTRRFEVELSGSGRVFGVKFRPGGFGAFTGHDVAVWTDRVVPLADVLDTGDLRERILAADDDRQRVRLMDGFLLERRPGPDPTYERLLGVVADMLADRGLTSVRAVCERHGVGQRTLQRLFRRYVGVGPKWVLQRFRLHDAQAMLDEGWAGDLSELAARLGWFDQAHFARDFRDLVGVPPSGYAGDQPAAR
ncbi:helix-turn-helix domain-containing protein [Nocardioides gansuensis]|uniref:helix-turn-helix domain-containing protein n=1 Tax=Nocardioides gansuensis TaxID=2138300 RepID=UPI001403079F|nr:helix-turn-helix domain-containing protein [Nocardioides gansuensis]